MNTPRIVIGSRSSVKLRAVNQALERLRVSAPSISCWPVDSGVSPQPVGLQETTLGARTRAINAQKSSSDEETLYIGIESGLMSLSSPDGSLDLAGPHIDLAIVCIINPTALEPTLVSSIGIAVPRHVANIVLNRRIWEREVSTVGEVVAELNPTKNIDTDDPHQFLCGRSRVCLLADALYTALLGTSFGVNAPERNR